MMEHQIIKFKRNFSLALLLMLLAWGLNSCYYDNVEDLYPIPPACDTLNITYSGTVAPIMENNCNSCHGSTDPSGGIITDTYAGVKVSVDDGSFWGAINHESGYSPMPQGGNKLSDCDLKKIGIWIDSGAVDD